MHGGDFSISQLFTEIEVFFKEIRILLKILINVDGLFLLRIEINDELSGIVL